MMETGRHVGNLPSEGKHHGSLQHPTAKDRDRSRGNLAGSWWKCGFTALHGTGGQKTLCEPKKKKILRTVTMEIPECCPPVMGLWSQTPQLTLQGGWQHQQGSCHELAQRQPPTPILAKMLETGKAGKLWLRKAGAFASGSQ